MMHIPLPLSKGLITKSALEPSFRSVDLCCDVCMYVIFIYSRCLQIYIFKIII